jgi:hypothetical protein
LFVSVLCLVYPMLTVSLYCVFCLFVSVLCLVYPMLTVSLYCLFVCLSLSCVWTLGTPDTGRRQTNKNTIQRYCQHWVHQTQDKDKQKQYTTQRYWSLSCVWCTQCWQYLCIVFLFVCLCPVSGVPNVDSISVLCFVFVYLCPVSGVPNVDSISV